MDKKLIFRNRILTVVISLLILPGYCFANSGLPSSHSKLNISVIYSNNNMEGPTDLTVEDFIQFGLRPESEKEWKRIKGSRWILINTITDAFSGKKTVFKILFEKVASPDRMIMKRILIDGQELMGYDKDMIANQLLGNAIEKRNQSQKK